MSELQQLPQAIEAEKGLLSAILWNVGALAMCHERKITADHFHHPAHAMIYRRLCEMNDARQPIDAGTLLQSLADAGLVESVGGFEYISLLSGHAPGISVAEWYADNLIGKRVLREIIRVGSEAVSEAYRGQDDPAGTLAAFERAALGIGSAEQKPEVGFSEHLRQALERLQERFERKSGMIGLPTGLKALDRLTGGLAAPDLVVVAAETSGGKTALACRFIEAAAVDAQVPVLVFSYEMTNEEITDRILASHARVNLLNYRQGWLKDADFGNLTAGVGRLDAARVFLRDEPDIGITQARAIARRVKQRHGLGLIVIDYAQLIPESSGKKGANREQEVAFISRGCKAMAKELNVPVVVLSQLNDDGKMRESRAIAHDANLLLMIQAEIGDDKIERHFIKIAKQRNGPRDRVPVTFLKQFTRFEDAAHQKPNE